MNLIQSGISPKTSLLIAIAAFTIPVVLIEYPLLQVTGGLFPYPLDDTCIHLAIAKNIAFHQVWGVSPTEFVSASSSVLYPLVLATVVKIFGAHLIIPFLVNIAAAVMLLVVLQRWLARQGLSALSQLWVLLAVNFLTPLPVLAVCGMEHVLQFLFVFLFLTQFSEELDVQVKSGNKTWILSWRVFAYAVLMAATRYEGLPTIAIACLILLLYRRVFLSFQLGIIAAIPVVLFGIYSLYKGNFFFPNSVLLKSGAPPMTFEGLYEYFTNGLFTRLFYSVVGYNTVAVQRLLFLLPLGFILLSKKIRENISYKYLLLLLTAAVFIHLALTGYASFPRYEAYLIGCSVAVLGMLVVRYGMELFAGRRDLAFWITAGVGLFLAFPLVLRSTAAFTRIKSDSINNFQIQYQLGQFLHQNYDKEAIAVEALGVVSYYTEGKKMDVVGLGDIEVARSIRDHYYSTDFLDSLSRREHVKIAVASEYSTDPELLKRWTRVASWQTPMEMGGYYVSFYAVDESMAPGLKRNLEAYQPLLPRGERVIYY